MLSSFQLVAFLLRLPFGRVFKPAPQVLGWVFLPLYLPHFICCQSLAFPLYLSTALTAQLLSPCFAFNGAFLLHFMLSHCCWQGEKEKEEGNGVVNFWGHV